ncbi:electron transport complex subunit RsxC [Marinicella sp. W31]|uniref:electron transport complex subunit RsxC n=1 Tax=Marinicella sp. W31 TaxID=3023713 RepID=UPI0037575D14
MVDKQQSLKHFHGGLVLKHHKRMSCEYQLMVAPAPAYVDISLRLNRGHIAESLVSIGDHVSKGQVIAKPVTERGCYVHASVSGQVADIRHQATASPDADVAPVIRIICDPQQQWTELRKPNFTADTEPSAIIDFLQHSGIIGMGGAGFPAHLKYQSSKKIHTLIINGAECEPYISCDERLMLDYTTDMINGSRWLMQAANAEQVIIAIEDNMGGVRSLIQEHVQAAGLSACMRVIKVPTIYPTGGEKQLIKVLMGQEVPSGGVPADLGVIMQNVATAKAVHDAIETGQPNIERVVTVTGDTVDEPRNYLTPIGTPIKHLLQLAKTDLAQTDKIVIGGPMMGYAMPHDEIGIDKTTNCILALAVENTRKKAPEMPCIRCGDCVKVCPQELLPQQLFWYIEGNNLEQAKQHHVFDCIECGACSWVCPSQINLVDYYRYAKSELAYLNYKESKAQQARERFEHREQRMQAVKAERQARRARQASRLKDKGKAKEEISAVLQRIKSKQNQEQDG